MIDGWGISCKITLRWMPLDPTDDKSTLYQVMAWCCQATSHYLSQCWPSFISPYGITRPQWVNKSSYIWYRYHFKCIYNKCACSCKNLYSYWIFCHTKCKVAPCKFLRSSVSHIKATECKKKTKGYFLHKLKIICRTVSCFATAWWHSNFTYHLKIFRWWFHTLWQSVLTGLILRMNDDEVFLFKFSTHDKYWLWNI